MLQDELSGVVVYRATFVSVNVLRASTARGHPLLVNVHVPHDQDSALKKHPCVVLCGIAARRQALHDHLTAADNQVPSERFHVINAANHRWIRLEVVGIDEAGARVEARRVLERCLGVVVVCAAVCATIRVDQRARDVGNESAVVAIRLLANGIVYFGARQIASLPSGKKAVI